MFVLHPHKKKRKKSWDNILQDGFKICNMQPLWGGGGHEEQRKGIVTFQKEVEGRDLQQEAG